MARERNQNVSKQAMCAKKQGGFAGDISTVSGVQIPPSASKSNLGTFEAVNVLIENKNLIQKYSFKGLPRLPEEVYKEFLTQAKHNFKILGLTEFEAKYLRTKVTVKFMSSGCHRENGKFVAVNKFKVVKLQDRSIDKALREARLLVKKSRHFRDIRKGFRRMF